MGRKSNKIRKPRLVEVREPNGRLSRAHDETAPGNTLTELKRLRKAALMGLKDAEWGTELGCLHLERKITAEMYGAGKWWRDMAAQYQSAINAPSQSPKAASLEQGRGGSQPDPDTENGRQRVTKDQRAVAQFHEAHAALLGAGPVAERHVRDLCERDIRPIGYYEMTATLRGLSWLVQWRQLDHQCKTGVVR